MKKSGKLACHKQRYKFVADTPNTAGNSSVI
jgi:hypothetical protein